MNAFRFISKISDAVFTKIYPRSNYGSATVATDRLVAMGVGQNRPTAPPVKNAPTDTQSDSVVVETQPSHFEADLKQAKGPANMVHTTAMDRVGDSHNLSKNKDEEQIDVKSVQQENTQTQHITDENPPTDTLDTVAGEQPVENSVEPAQENVVAEEEEQGHFHGATEQAPLDDVIPTEVEPVVEEPVSKEVVEEEEPLEEAVEAVHATEELEHQIPELEEESVLAAEEAPQEAAAVESSVVEEQAVEEKEAPIPQLEEEVEQEQQQVQVQQEEGGVSDNVIPDARGFDDFDEDFDAIDNVVEVKANEKQQSEIIVEDEQVNDVTADADAQQNEVDAEFELDDAPGLQFDLDAVTRDQVQPVDDTEPQGHQNEVQDMQFEEEDLDDEDQPAAVPPKDMDIELDFDNTQHANTRATQQPPTLEVEEELVEHEEEAPEQHEMAPEVDLEGQDTELTQTQHQNVEPQNETEEVEVEYLEDNTEEASNEVALDQLYGVGEKTRDKLLDAGVGSIERLAGLSDAEVAELSSVVRRVKALRKRAIDFLANKQ